jgi:arsenite-transporting ATPase
MGKGEVGKLMVAAAITLELTQRGPRVHPSTTKPTAHVAATVKALEPFPGLSIARIDPALATARYAAEVTSRAGSDLDPSGQALLAEELRSPCTMEIAVFRAFAQAVAQGQDRIVVLDTAPTGYTISIAGRGAGLPA